MEDEFCAVIAICRGHNGFSGEIYRSSDGDASKFGAIVHGVVSRGAADTSISPTQSVGLFDPHGLDNGGRIGFPLFNRSLIFEAASRRRCLWGSDDESDIHSDGWL